ncbi:uncharacterized protein CXQ87_001848 [Candidozyma duobushaemuli]|uniref:Uncharacterized protein n=2 Tax=Candidozyma TaxID=3303203 RepID=A0ABX8I4K7_9ASCO|nr:uncharacterized protein CXQ87_001848 [[Candida] duobushaemulonis]PVH13730.1 hypothetical protein CXQ87_001848 [[Candida] duobushaemulonis]QWU88037.1 hypothetical protein CA3LBN_002302 [[Candida] haemuloni]
MSALKNLAALKRNIHKRLRQALEELQENLGQEWGQRAPARIPVVVPRSKGFRRMNVIGQFQQNRGYSTFFGTNHQFGWSLFDKWTMGRGFRARACKGQFRFFSGFCPFSGRKVGTGLVSQNFAQRSYSSKASKLYKIPSLTQLAHKDFCQAFEEEEDQRWNKGIQSAVAELFKRKEPAVQQSEYSTVDISRAVPAVLKTSIQGSPHYHDLVKRLGSWATEEIEPAVSGVYVDFRYAPRLSVPDKTVLTTDVVDEMMDNLARFREKLAEVQRDLARLSELGELPVEVVQDEGVIRVFFPNCDRERLETLLVEKNVVGGVIHEGASAGSSSESDAGSEFSYGESVPSETTSWFLSASDMPSPSLSSGSTASSQDILSSQSSQRIVRLEPVPPSSSVHIVEEHEWAV